MVPTKLRAFRIKYGFTQSSFADFLEIPLKTLQNWEQGRTECPEYLLKLIAYKISGGKEDDV